MSFLQPRTSASPRRTWRTDDGAARARPVVRSRAVRGVAHRAADSRGVHAQDRSLQADASARGSLSQRTPPPPCRGTTHRQTAVRPSIRSTRRPHRLTVASGTSRLLSRARRVRAFFCPHRRPRPSADGSRGTCTSAGATAMPRATTTVEAVTSAGPTHSSGSSSAARANVPFFRMIHYRQSQPLCWRSAGSVTAGSVTVDAVPPTQ